MSRPHILAYAIFISSDLQARSNGRSREGVSTETTTTSQYLPLFPILLLLINFQ